MSFKQRILVSVGVVVAAGVLAIIFLAYQHPDMLIDFSNLLFCG